MAEWPKSLPTPWRSSSAAAGLLTILHVHGAADPEDHLRRIREWALPRGRPGAAIITLRGSGLKSNRDSTGSTNGGMNVNQPLGSGTRLLRMTQLPFMTALVAALLCAAPVYAQDDDYARQVAQERRQAEFEAPQLAEVLGNWS